MEILKMKEKIKEEVDFSMLAAALLNEGPNGFCFKIFVIIQHFMLTQVCCKSDPDSKNIKIAEALTCTQI